MELHAVYACLIAFAVAAVLTPFIARLARRIGAVDEMKARGLAEQATPLLGGLGIFGATLAASLLYLPQNPRTDAILAGAALITVVGAVDDARELPPGVKLLGQIGAALILVLNDVTVQTFTLPFLGRVDLGNLGAPIKRRRSVAGSTP